MRSCEEISQGVSDQSTDRSALTCFECYAWADTAVEELPGESAGLDGAAVATTVADSSSLGLVQGNRTGHFHMLPAQSRVWTAEAQSAQCSIGRTRRNSLALPCMPAAGNYRHRMEMPRGSALQPAGRKAVEEVEKVEVVEVVERRTTRFLTAPLNAHFPPMMERPPLCRAEGRR